MNNVVLRQIVRLSDGLIGGYIESEDNLSQFGKCFVYDGALVKDNAKVLGDVELRENCKIVDSAVVKGNVVIGENVIVGENALVDGSVHLSGRVKVRGHSRIVDKASLDDQVIVEGNAYIGGKVIIGGNVVVKDNARIIGNVVASENACIGGTCQICDNAIVRGKCRIYCGSIGGSVEVKGGTLLIGKSCIFGDAVLKDVQLHDPLIINKTFIYTEYFSTYNSKGDYISVTTLVLENREHIYNIYEGCRSIKHLGLSYTKAFELLKTLGLSNDYIVRRIG